MQKLGICRQFVAKQNKIVAQNSWKYLFINEYRLDDKSKILKSLILTDIVKDASLFSFNRYLQIGGKNKMVNVRKRGNVYEFNFDVAKIEGKRKRMTKSGFKTKAEALKQETIYDYIIYFTINCI